MLLLPQLSSGKIQFKGLPVMALTFADRTPVSDLFTNPSQQTWEEERSELYRKLTELTRAFDALRERVNLLEQG